MKRIFLFLITIVFLSQNGLLAKQITLQEAIRLALKQNPEILMAEGKLKTAQGETREESSMAKPQLALHGFGLTSNTGTMVVTVPGVMPEGWIMSPSGGAIGGSLALSIPVYTGGNLGEMARSAFLNESARMKKLEAAGLDVTLKTKLAYYAVLQAQGDLEAAKADLRNLKEAKKITEEMFNNGKVARFYLFRSNARLALSRQNLIHAQNDLQLRSVELAVTLGESSSTLFLPADKLDENVDIPPSMEPLFQTAYANRPDLQAANSQVDSMEAQVKAAQGLLQPQLYFFSRYDKLSNSPGTFNGLNTGFVLSFPLFDGGERKGGIEKAIGELQTSEGELKNLKLQIHDQVTEAYVNLHSALEELQAAKEEVKSAEENSRVVMLRFKTGKGIELEVLDGEDTLTSARTHYIKALYDSNASEAFLEWALGLAWRHP